MNFDTLGDTSPPTIVAQRDNLRPVASHTRVAYLLPARHAHARRRIRALALVLFVVSHGIAHAQEPRRGAVDSALRAVEQAGADEQDRARALGRLGEHDSPEVTQVLLAEVARASTPELRRAAVRALGRRARAGAIAPLAAALDGAGNDYMLRNAAADGLANQGPPGVESLIARLVALPEGLSRQQRWLQQSLLRALGRANSPTATAAIAAAARRGAPGDRVDALRALAGAAPTEAVSELRLEAARHTYPALAAEGVRQLAHQGHADALALTLAAHRRVVAMADGAAHAAMLDALTAVLAPAGFDALFEHIAFAAPEVDVTLGEVAGRLRADAAFVQWLLSSGLHHASGRCRAAAVRLLAGVEGETVTKALLTAVTAADPEVARPALRALAERHATGVEAALRQQLAHGRPIARYEALRGLHSLCREQPGWQAELLGYLDERDVTVRALAIDLLADVAAAVALPRVHSEMDDAAWSMRATAYAFCARVPSVASIPVLIARLDHERGRLREDVLDALQALTAQRFADHDTWQRWWAQHGSSFEPLPPSAPDRSQRSHRPAPAWTRATYYDLPVVSERCTFVVDISGSMDVPHGSDGSTRLALAQRQLVGIVEQADAALRFNLIFCSTTAKALWPKLTAADSKKRAQARQAIAACSARGGTNLVDALELAFADAEVDTIYVLSDGWPSAGPIRDPEALADEVARWNRPRRIRIHTITLGSRSPLLERLARDSGGEHVRVES